MHLRTSSAPRFDRAWCGPLTPPPLHRMRCLREPRKIQRRRQNCTKAVSVLCCASQMIVSQASIRRNPNRSPGTTLVPFPRGKSSRRFTDPASVYQQMMRSVAYFGLVCKGAKLKNSSCREVVFAPEIRADVENRPCDIDFAAFYILPMPSSLTAKWRRVKIGSLSDFLLRSSRV